VVQALLVTAALAVLCGCGQGRLPAEALVLTQVPVAPPAAGGTGTVLDERYPPGSRVVLVNPPTRPESLRVLSKGLSAAGCPVISADGRRLVFAGRAGERDTWQLYEARLGGGRPRRLTSLPGGAMDPAILGNGTVVFSSPVPPAGQTWSAKEPAALHVLAADGAVKRLTYGVSAAVDPTVLNDGRVLFVSAKPGEDSSAGPVLGLYTINNDGTEVAAYALDREGAPWVGRPRELQDGRVGFLAAAGADGPLGPWPESVPNARPFAGRSRMLPFAASRCRSVEPGLAGAVLASLETRGLEGRAMSGSFAVFEIPPTATQLETPLFDDPAWHDLEAQRPGQRPPPLGHISTMSAAKDYGTLLCLNANFSRERAADGSPLRRAVQVRVTARGDDGAVRALGESPLQPDGSFMVEVPVDRPLGFESLDASGAVIHRLPPAIWVRAGENRTCIGCHEPCNRSPRNLRPMAVNEPVVRLGLPRNEVAQAVP
jgi:hypothetical protein